MKLRTIVLISLFFVASCSTLNRYIGPSYIKINDPARVENFTNEQLRNFIKKTPSPTVIVRGQSNTGPQISASQSSNSDRICSILEMSLAKNGLDVRDRALFENVINSSSGELSYESLYEKTQVDMLLEISSYSLSDYYIVDGYYDQFNRYFRFPQENLGTRKYPNIIQPQYKFRGMSITIKVILLKDNLIGGSYSYSYVPCSAESGGAEIINMYPLRYRPNGSNRDIDAILSDGLDPMSGSSRITTATETLNMEMENFLTNVVVGQMLSDMRGEQYIPQVPTSLSTVAAVNPGTVNNQGAAHPQPSSIAPSSKQKPPKKADVTMDRFTQELISYLSGEKSSDNGGDSLNAEDNPAAAQNTPQNAVYEDFKLEEWLGRYEMTRNLMGHLVSEKIENDTRKIQSAKKRKNVVSDIEAETETDMGKLLYLKGTPQILSLHDFVRDNSHKVSGVPKVDDGYILFCLPQYLIDQTNAGKSYYLFIDGSLYGTGNSADGMCAVIPGKEFENDFHDLKIYSLSGTTPVLAYSSIVHFDAKHKFVFSETRKKGFQLN